MTTEIDSDVDLILRTLCAWSERENDPQTGRYTLKTDELLQATKLSHERVEDAVTLLANRGLVNAVITLGGLQEVAPTAEGRAYFQRSGTSINNDSEEPSETDVEYEVFLSHSNLDDDFAKNVKTILDASGIRTFATPGSIPTGKWEPQIERALQRSVYIWVLITPKALGQSVWTHHEFGYFYGYRHGKGEDAGGHKCRFLFTEGTQLRGLYGEIQGVRIDSFDDPVSIARVIAKEIGRGFKEPPNREELRDAASGRATTPPEGLDEMQVVGTSSSAAPDYSYGICTIDITSPKAIFNVSAVTWHPEVAVWPLKTLPQVGAGQKQQLSLRVEWAKRENVPKELQDSFKRRFPLRRPRDPGPPWAPLYLTFETQSGQIWAAVAYMQVERQIHGHPETRLLYGPNSYGWVRGRTN